MSAKTELFAKWLQGSLVIADQALGIGNRWFVDPASTTGGTTAGYGANPDKPFTTMAAALSACEANDTIYVLSAVSEGDLTLSKANVTIIGVGASPHTIVWQQSAVDQILLTITGANCKVKNIRFRCPARSAGTVVAGLSLDGASGAVIEDCVFRGRTGSYYAIATPGNADNVTIRNCEFKYHNTATYGTAIYGHTYTADVIGSGWLIEGCVFHSNLKHIECRLRQSVIRNNQFAAIGLKPDGTALTATTMINLSGGSNAMWNLVTGNMLPGDYSTATSTAGTNDSWVGNYADDVSESEVGDNGITIAVPAA